MKDSVQEILSFWFAETAPVQWFQTNDVFDSMVRDRFLPLYDIALKGLCDSWAKEVDGALALVLLFDQFPRNMFRGKPESFATDARALSVAEQAIERGFDVILPPVRRRFMYLPFEHSENIAHQNRSVQLFLSMKDQDPLGHEYAIRHQKIIEKYGRFPHRNEILGRANTGSETEFLESLRAGLRASPI